MSTLDIRSPLGWIFTIIGTILVGYGVLVEPSASTINATWGGVLIVFGVSMLGLAHRDSKVAHSDE